MKRSRKRFLLLAAVALRLCAQSPPPDSAPADIPKPTLLPAAGGGEERSAAEASVAGVLPAPPATIASPVLQQSAEGVDWSHLFRACGRFLAIEHGFRLLTEPGTRSGLKGSFFANYAAAVGNLHGWADGDEFYVNYVGHPMQGSVAGFLWILNDRAYRGAEFGKNRLYWRSRLRAAAFAWAYSEQFEIGLLSEASIGAIQAPFPQQGFVDHVVTPAIGLSWMIAEDAVDQYLIQRIERATGNRFVRMAARSALNPSRTFANFLQGNAPWHRETREGILSFVPNAQRAGRRAEREVPDVAGPAPFELDVAFRQERFSASKVDCLGASATAAFRVSGAWQLLAAAGGCKMMRLDENLSGDSLTYMAGPRFRSRDWGRWSFNLQLLVGGNKLTQERMYPERKKLLEAAASRDPKAQLPSHSDYTDETARNGFSLRGGGGFNYKLNAALTLRIAELNYQHSWAGTLWGRSFSDAVQFSSGVVLRMGTW